MSDSAFRPGPDPDAEWAAVLRQLRQPPATQPGPFFYARVQARLLAAAGPARAWLPPWARRPAYAVVLAALVLAVSGDGSTAAPTRQAAPRQAGH